MAVHYMSERQDWATPQALFDALNAEFGFTLDPCALPHNAKCAKFYTPDDNGLAQDWTGERVFMNPPYGRAIRDWMRKAHEHAAGGGLAVCLVPARTDTAWWHDYTKGAAIRFIRGRVKFGDSKQGAPFPSALVIFNAEAQ
jgi:site-specific DNA-methyltransferase (adenine-specific)